MEKQNNNNNIPKGRGRGRSQNISNNSNPQNNFVRALNFTENQPIQSSLINDTNDVSNKNNFEDSQIEIKSSQDIIKNSEKNRSLIVSKLNYEFAPKPKQSCSLGRKISLEANYYRINMNKKFTVYQYDITIRVENSPNEIFTEEILNGFYDEFIKKYKELEYKIFHDFKKSLYCINEEILIIKFEFEMKHRNNTRRFSVDIQKTGCIEFDNAIKDQIQITILQLLLTFRFKTNYISLDRHKYFDPFKCVKQDLGLNVKLWKGFFISVRPTEDGLTINLNLFNGAFSEEKNLIDIACIFFECQPEQLKNFLIVNINNDNRRAEFNRFGYPKDLRTFTTLIKSFKVTPTHLEYRPKKNVHALTPKSSNETLVSDQNINITKYFLDGRGIILKYPELPCIDLGNGNKTPIELLVTVVENKKNIDNKMQRDYIQKTAIDCQTRALELDDMLRNISFKDDRILANLDLKIEPRRTKLDGCVLDSPILLYGSEKSVNVRDGRWDNMNKQFVDPKSISNWIVYSFENRIMDKIKNLVAELKKIAKQHGLIINDPLEIYEPNFDEKKDCYKFLENELKYFKKKSKNIDLILAILPGQNSEIYDALKTFGDISYGIQTQSLDKKSLEKDKKTNVEKLFQNGGLSNVCLKINSKLGGTNFLIDKKNYDNYVKYLKTLLDDNDNSVMIFGCDVNKPSPINKSRNKKETVETIESIAAVTGSIDQNYANYAARMIAQKKEKKDSIECVYDFKYPVKELLELYKTKNNKFPKRLIFFRDGISEGEFQKILNHEMNQIREACSEIASGYQPGVTYIIVSKRHHTRFFPLDPRDKTGKCKNVPPGTLVDTRVVTPNLFDYFLNSHLGIQGTTKPCHYFILYDENELKDEQIILLSHYLCHIYERSTTAVSYPAPTYYADHAAERGRKYLQDKIPKNYYPQTNRSVSTYPINVHENFKDKMFFI